jgi:flagellar motor switch protein FliN
MADEQPPVSDSSQSPQAGAAPSGEDAQLADLTAALSNSTSFEAAPAPNEMPDQAAIDALLHQANFEDVPNAVRAPVDSADAATAQDAAPLPDAASFELPNFNQVMQDARVSSIELLRDVDLNVKIELGRSRMLVEDVLKLAEGSVVELDKFAGDPVDVFVNDRLVARGEVLVLNDNFCVRVNEIVAGIKEEGL